MTMWVCGLFFLLFAAVNAAFMSLLAVFGLVRACKGKPQRERGSCRKCDLFDDSYRQGTTPHGTVAIALVGFFLASAVLNVPVLGEVLAVTALIGTAVVAWLTFGRCHADYLRRKEEKLARARQLQGEATRLKCRCGR